MRHFHLMMVRLVSGVCIAWLCVGCELPPEAPSPETPQAEALGSTGDVAASAQEYTARLAAAQRPQPQAAAPVANQVMWLAPTETAEVILAQNRSVEVTSESQSPSPPVILLENGAGGNTQAATAIDAGDSSAATRSQLASAMLDRIRLADEPDFHKALNAAAVSLADPHHDLDFRFISLLPPQQQEAVQQYHSIVIRLHEQLLVDEGRLDRAALEARFDELFGEQPVGIGNMTLCRRVMGYGVYEPFDSTTFLAGRNHKMIVYVELDHFRSIPQGNSQFGVNLQQEVTLYSADGLAVWRNEPVRINDVSRNQRRDFFVVQLITLPDRLSVGKYRLKIRVTDLNGGSIDEQGLDLNIVADRALVQNAPSPNESKPLRRR